MACENWSQRLDLYLDGEMPSSEVTALNAHLDACSDCAADALRRVQLKRSVASAGKRYDASPELRSKVLRSITKRSRSEGAWVWKLLVAPAVLVLILSLGVQFFVRRENARRTRVYSELADLHVAALASANPVDVVSTDRHAVKPWFQGKIPFSFNLPELQGSEFTLVGGRVTYFGQSPGAQLIYQWRKHMISVFIFQHSAERLSDSSPVRANSFNFETFAHDGLQYFLVGDVNSEQIRQLGNLLRNAD
jgi:anti-sigma factor (TIGR02949 family)